MTIDQNKKKTIKHHYSVLGMYIWTNKSACWSTQIDKLESEALNGTYNNTPIKFVTTLPSSLGQPWT